MTPSMAATEDLLHTEPDVYGSTKLLTMAATANASGTSATAMAASHKITLRNPGSGRRRSTATAMGTNIATGSTRPSVTR